MLNAAEHVEQALMSASSAKTTLRGVVEEVLINKCVISYLVYMINDDELCLPNHSVDKLSFLSVEGRMHGSNSAIK